MSVETTNAVGALSKPTAGTLKRQAVRGVKIASLATVAKTAIDFGAQLGLARILAFDHFGVFAVAQTLTGFVSCLSDLAGQKFLVRHPNADRRAFSTIFWIELLLGFVVAAGWALACVPILTKLGQPEQIPFAQALAIWIFAERLMLPRAVLDRAMKFGRVNIAQLAGVIGGAATLITTALLGWGAWVLVAGLIARTVVTAAFVWLSAAFVPMLAFDRKLARELLTFGAPLMLATAMTFAYTNIDYLIVEAVAGYSMLGLYYAAYRYPHYLNQFNVVLASVVFPTFTKARDDAHLARGLHLLTRYSAAFAFLPILAMWFEGEALLRLLLGERWLAALFPFQCFTTLAALRLAFVHWNHVFVVKGRTRVVMLTSLANLPLIAVAAWIGVKWAGINGAALLVTLAALATLFLCCCFLLKQVLAFSYLRALMPVLKAALASAVVMLLVKMILPAVGANAILVLVLGSIIYGVIIFQTCGCELRKLLLPR